LEEAVAQVDLSTIEQSDIMTTKRAKKNHHPRKRNPCRAEAKSREKTTTKVMSQQEKLAVIPWQLETMVW
jgi:uncharacterized protein with WD repeat